MDIESKDSCSLKLTVKRNSSPRCISTLYTTKGIRVISVTGPVGPFARCVSCEETTTTTAPGTSRPTVTEEVVDNVKPLIYTSFMMRNKVLSTINGERKKKKKEGGVILQ